VKTVKIFQTPSFSAKRTTPLPLPYITCESGEELDSCDLTERIDRADMGRTEG
jgi:hypothetical protein